MKQIQWVPKDKGSIKSWYGYIDGTLLFVIDRFKDDDALMTSNVVPLKNRIIVDPDPEALQTMAMGILYEFITGLIE